MSSERIETERLHRTILCQCHAYRGGQRNDLIASLKRLIEEFNACERAANRRGEWNQASSYAGSSAGVREAIRIVEESPLWK